MTAQSSDVHIVFDFNSEKTSGQWLPVNDSVMGGISNSTFELTSEGTGLFTGTVSLENNGGFASVRALVDTIEFRGYKGIKIRVRGDGNTYSLRLRADRFFDGVSFRTSFATEKDTWIELSFPFDAFIPGFRGRTLNNIGQIDPTAISQMGFLISDKQTGAFALEIDWIASYK